MSAHEIWLVTLTRRAVSEEWWGKSLVQLGSRDDGRGGIGDNQYKQLSEEFPRKREAKK